jgi:L-asparaginase II
MTNPLLIELTRGPLVESVHRGAIALCRSTGEAVLAVGDVGLPVFPRSAIKAIQCLPLIESGAADRFGFGAAEIALACASHSATPRHVEVASAMLASCGQDAGALACGPHDPVHEPSARAMHVKGEAPTRLHNNCSGKHAGMVAACVHCGFDVAGYADVGHPHQTAIARALGEVTGAEIRADRVGIDGCSAPNWAISLTGLATGYARLATGEGLAAERRRAAERIRAAVAAEPGMVAGPGRLDTVAMAALGPKVFMKTGAEAVYCGGFPETGLGFAIKIDDGSKRASEAFVEAILLALFPGAFAPQATARLKNYAGLDIGETRLSAIGARTVDAITKL